MVSCLWSVVNFLQFYPRMVPNLSVSVLPFSEPMTILKPHCAFLTTAWTYYTSNLQEMASVWASITLLFEGSLLAFCLGWSSCPSDATILPAFVSILGRPVLLRLPLCYLTRCSFAFCAATKRKSWADRITDL